MHARGRQTCPISSRQVSGDARQGALDQVRTPTPAEQNDYTESEPRSSTTKEKGWRRAGTVGDGSVEIAVSFCPIHRPLLACQHSSGELRLNVCYGRVRFAASWPMVAARLRHPVARGAHGAHRRDFQIQSERLPEASAHNAWQQQHLRSSTGSKSVTLCTNSDRSTTPGSPKVYSNCSIRWTRYSWSNGPER